MIITGTVSAGNRFIHIEESAELPLEREALAILLCDPGKGYGADGVVFYSNKKEKTFFFIHNRDGSAAEISGNGMAGLAAHFFSLYDNLQKVSLQTAVGPRNITLKKKDPPEFIMDVEIGPPSFRELRFFPFLSKKDPPVIHEGISLYPVSVGNPHAVVFLDHPVPEEELWKWGRKLETAAIFPQKTNVEFVEWVGDDSCRSWFYERGVGPTGSSSTGSAAVYAVLRKLGRIGESLRIECPGGEVQLSGSETIFIRNHTRIEYRGDCPME